jgi:uncharacterized protein
MMVSAFGIAATVLLGLLGLVYFRQEKLLFFPEPLPDDFTHAMPGFEQVPIPVDGATLVAVHLKLPQPKGVIFFLHGNAGNVKDWIGDPQFYRTANFDLFMIDYRGYGRSSGRIQSEAQLHRDVDVAWEQVAAQYKGLRKVVYGRSLGTALAARLAARIQPDLTILVSAYWSMAELARLHYPLLPGFLLRYPMMTFRDVGRIEGRILLIHGDQDRLIPFEHSVRLRALAQNADLARIADASHTDLQEFDPYLRAIADALAPL